MAQGFMSPASGERTTAAASWARVFSALGSNSELLESRWGINKRKPPSQVQER